MTSPHHDFETKLKTMRPKSLTQEEKESLWIRVMHGISLHETQRASRSPFLFMRYRFVITAFLIVALAGSSFATVGAANGAKPGDLLFPLDIAAERVQLVFTPDTKKGELRIRFSEERLDEARVVLALLLNGADTSSSIESTAAVTSDESNTSVSTTTENTTAITLISTSSNTSLTTSSLQLATTSTSSENTIEQELKEKAEVIASKLSKLVSTKNIQKAEHALLVALSHLETTKMDLERADNEVAVIVIDEIIADLSNLVENHIAELNRVKTVIKEDNEKIKVELAASSDILKTKFRLVQRTNDDDEDDKNDNRAVSFSNSNGKTTIKLSSDELEIKFKNESKGKKEKNNDTRRDDDDEDEDDDRGDDDRNDNQKNRDRDDDDDEKSNNKKSNNNDKKLKLCHIPPGNPGAAHTIMISVAAARAHLSHGDHLGACGDDDNGGDDDDTATSTDTTAPIISNLSASAATSSAAITWTTNESATSKVYYGTNTPLSLAGASSTESSATTTSHSLSLAGLTASTTYYYVAESSDPSGNTATSSEQSFTTNAVAPPADTAAPVISSLSISPSSTSAVVSWSTNEQSTSTLSYATASPVDPATASTSSSNALSTNHSRTLTGLMASTTYYLIITATDASNNSATSTQQTFATLPLPDTTAPLISSLNASPTSTAATVSWTTDEPATSKLYYSTSTPLNISLASTTSDSSLVTSHSLNTSGLTASSTYYYAVESADAANNTASSTEQSFTTL